jgi:hypothetical protein
VIVRSHVGSVPLQVPFCRQILILISLNRNPVAHSYAMTDPTDLAVEFILPLEGSTMAGHISKKDSNIFIELRHYSCRKIMVGIYVVQYKLLLEIRG